MWCCASPTELCPCATPGASLARTATAINIVMALWGARAAIRCPPRSQLAGVNGPRATSSGPGAWPHGLPPLPRCVSPAWSACSLPRRGVSRCGGHACSRWERMHACASPMLEGTVCYVHGFPYAPPARPTPCALCAHRLRSRAGGRGVRTGVCVCGRGCGCTHAHPWHGHARPSVALARVCVCGRGRGRTHAHPWHGHARPSVALARVCVRGARVRARMCVCACACVCARWLRVRLRGELRRIFTPLAACSDLVSSMPADCAMRCHHRSRRLPPCRPAPCSSTPATPHARTRKGSTGLVRQQ
jgi:hypothetical protein